jgi:hypothetical protein
VVGITTWSCPSITADAFPIASRVSAIADGHNLPEHPTGKHEFSAGNIATFEHSKTVHMFPWYNFVDGVNDASLGNHP